mmetsp:Transcript_31271/g.100993  ORF Transcript_31271/g.100993 Transcript_31271/m.100993 type:complete len:364 (-) Transcript_31271:120-1211(-)
MTRIVIVIRTRRPSSTLSPSSPVCAPILMWVHRPCARGAPPGRANRPFSPPCLYIALVPSRALRISDLKAISAKSTFLAMVAICFCSSNSSDFCCTYSSTWGSLDVSCGVSSRLALRSARAARSRSASTRLISSLIRASISLRLAVSPFSSSDSSLSTPNLCLISLSTWIVSPVVSLSRSSSLLRSSIFSRYCWFSILSWSKSMACSTSPKSSFCCNWLSSFATCAFSCAFFRRSFSIIEPFERILSSMCRTTFSATVLPVRTFSAPITTSRLNSYASFLISEIRISVSSIWARSESTRASCSVRSLSVSSRMSSISWTPTSCFWCHSSEIFFITPCLRCAAGLRPSFSLVNAPGLRSAARLR